MSWSFALFTFINAWWISLFLVLPFAWRAEDSNDAGYKAAPKTPRWKKVIIANSLLSLVFTAILALLIHFNAVALKDLK